MKGSCTLVASMLAATTVALSSSSAENRDVASYPYLDKVSASSRGRSGASNAFTISDKEKFAPRFDGLRFTVTLVTAHR